MNRRLRILWRQLHCRHNNRTREGVYRPMGCARRRERYHCPDCGRLWSVEAPLSSQSNSASLPS